MNPTPRHALLPFAAALAVAVVIGVRLERARRAADIPVPPPPNVAPEALRVAPPPAAAPESWDVLEPDRAPGGLARRFRLAGTLFSGGARVESPMAVIDDREEVRQRLVREGETVAGDVRLVEVRPTSVVLEGAEGRAELAIERPAPASRTAGGGDAAGSSSGDGGEENRFGGREVFPGRWAFSRDRLLEYYTELRAEPERLVAIFDSMEPLYKNNDPETHLIEGYRLNVRGEGEFFEAMGMRQGDIVRAVNSVQMANRRRAETCIRAFIEGEEDTFVFDFERDGVPEQTVYVFE